MITVTVQSNTHTDPVPVPVQCQAQATAHPLLVIVAEMAEDRFTGGFTVVHTPTGLRLPTLPTVEPVDPSSAEYAAALVAHLDWSSTDRADYQDTHRGAWLDALNAAARAAAICDEDEQRGLLAGAIARAHHLRAGQGGAA
ncbi:hypothetical protein [Pseudonocardia sp. MH-G8]|uniref:hypothetical protein n=1 Tax=Pseudonocardia sp. MH-G8 TaxID=1854588 RepID=UPI000BA01F39|nr:hypothetical protein [Pseudonocardia sp. MH-G8]OZM79916.1 hypothetical protein CFP66_23210 [Pseudonocardia sp. MH-G8]